MSINLFEEVNKMMGTPISKKESPVENNKKEYEKTLEGAALPAALAGIYHLATSEAGAKQIINHLLIHAGEMDKADSDTSVAITFGNKAEEVITKITAYSGANRLDAYGSLNKAARLAYQVMQREIGKDTLATEEVTQFMVAQRHTILSHLPEVLQLGHLLGDETIDDVSNKMNGPISNLMHSLGESFSGSPK
jgi:hypothetical protein